MRLLTTAVAVAAAASFAATPAAGVKAPTPKKLLWATVNVCAADSGPNTFGIRASMPGNGTSQRMYMRFFAQSYNAKKRRYVLTGARSDWMRVGDADFVSRQAGYSFDFTDPPAGGRFKLRGLVRFQWRELRSKGSGKGKRWVVAKQRERITRGGRKGVKGGDPPGRSDAVCLVESEPQPAG